MSATQTFSPCIICCPVPYVAAVSFFFDAEGATSWMYSFHAHYQARSYTKIERIITVKSATGKTGDCFLCQAGPPPCISLNQMG
jgi:hypothetical protein